MPDNSISVKQLNLYVKSLLDSDVNLCNVTVTGEISNFKDHYQSGHWYFTLKDSEAQIRCVMFKWSNINVGFMPKDSMSVTVKGRVSIFEKDGQYQLYCEQLYENGVGDLAIKFAEIKEKLEKEGLFDSSSKRPLVKFPKTVAVVTSDTGAAVRDILNILNRRYPICKIIMCPVKVQGEGAAEDMISALERLYALSDIDTVIIGRGGGSAEDLDAFNDEKLARKIYESPFPIISAVGHETDFSICDFVADKRAATPSEAAELAVPDISDLKLHILEINKRLINMLTAKYNLFSARYDALASKKVFADFNSVISAKAQLVDSYSLKIADKVNLSLTKCHTQFEALALKLDALSPMKTLLRGYASVSASGKSVKSICELKENQNITLTLVDGNADCTVNSVSERK